MPDAHGKLAGHGWSRKHEAAWERVFGDPASGRPAVLPEPSPEVLRPPKLFDEEDAQAARDGYNPEW
jgi:hypothetical protein